MNTRKFLKLIIPLILLTLLVGCGGPGAETPAPTEEPRQPFSASSESQDGAFASWSGYTDGYQAGGEAEFEISLKNGTDQVWKGRLCLNLVSGEASPTAHTLKQRDFELQPGMGFSETIQVQIPEGLGDGTYGLSTVVYKPTGPGVDMIPIQIGEGKEKSSMFTQQEMDASREACPPVDTSALLIDQAKADLADALGIEIEDIEVQQVEEKEFPDASLGVPEPGKSYAQVVVSGYVIVLQAEGEAYRYHAGQGRVVRVPDQGAAEGTQTAPPGSTLPITDEVPRDSQQVVLPLHILAEVGQPGETLNVTLRWDDGTELTDSISTLEGPGGSSYLIGSMDWQTESQPPRPETQSAVLQVEDSSGNTLLEKTLTALGTEDPLVESIDLYWLLGEQLESEQRPVIAAGSLEAKAVQELLWGPPPRNLAGFRTGLPTPEEVLNYPGRSQDWGIRVKLLGFTLEDGTATVNFSQEMAAYGGGSARVGAIREQITRTLTQFDSIDEVVIAVEGKTEAVLQP